MELGKQIYFLFIICFVCLHSSLVWGFSSQEGTKACASTVYITGYANHGCWLMILCFGQKTSKQKVYNKIQWHFNMFVQDPIVSIAPTKPNSDLWSDVAKKIEKLEQCTQWAIIKLMRKYIISLYHQGSLLLKISGKFSSKSVKRQKLLYSQTCPCRLCSSNPQKLWISSCQACLILKL